MRALALAVLLLPAAARADSRLLGTWNKDGRPFARLEAGGAGRVDDDAVRWKADGKTLTLVYGDGTVESMAYALKGDSLRVMMDGEPATFTRAGGKAKGGQAAPAAAAPAGRDELSALLLSSAWCHFRYNKLSGSSSQRRVVFARDGSWSSGARSESHSSGASGTVAGQSDSSSGGRWKAGGGRLLMSEGGGALEDVGLSVSRNSNGYPILDVGGKEYSQCR